MKILFVEDQEYWAESFQVQLKKLGEVTRVKSYKGAQIWLFKDGNIKDVDLIVCDHNILFWENERGRYAEGLHIYKDIRRKEMRNRISNVPFIHFSSEPCPEKYKNKEPDSNFYSFHKTESFDLKKAIDDKVQLG